MCYYSHMHCSSGGWAGYQEYSGRIGTVSNVNHAYWPFYFLIIILEIVDCQ